MKPYNEIRTGARLFNEAQAGAILGALLAAPFAYYGISALVGRFFG